MCSIKCYIGLYCPCCFAAQESNDCMNSSPPKSIHYSLYIFMFPRLNSAWSNKGSSCFQEILGINWFPVFTCGVRNQRSLRHSTARDVIILSSEAKISIQGLGLRNQFSPFHSVLHFSEWSHHWLSIEYHVNIWQVSPQHSDSKELKHIWIKSIFFPSGQT